MPAADLIVLPGSKAVCSDLAWLREMGWETAIARHLRYGGKLIGICGGLQMRGGKSMTRRGLKARQGASPAWAGWIMETTLHREKTLRNVAGTLTLPGAPPCAVTVSTWG